MRTGSLPKLRGVKDLPDKEPVSIAPAEGKLGVLIPGMGAVTTTFIAGVEAIKRNLAKPIGSVTQMAAIRLGKRTEGRSPRIKDFVPLAGLDDLVFGTWDIYPDTCYEAAEKAGVLEMPLLEQLREPLSAIRPMPAVFDHEFVRRIDGPNKRPKASKMDHAEMLMDDIRGFQESTGAARMAMIWCGSTEVFHKPAKVHQTLVSQPSRKSIRLCAGARVPRKQGVPLRRPGGGTPPVQIRGNVAARASV